MNRILRPLLLLLLVALNIGCDQVSKTAVRDNVHPHEEIRLVQENVILTNVENTGAMLSTGANLPDGWKQVLLIGLPALMLLAMLGALLFRSGMPKMAVLGLACMVGGGIGNLADRIAYGSVTDFLFIDVGVLQTGIFNMADVSISAGMALVLGSLFFKR